LTAKVKDDKLRKRNDREYEEKNDKAFDLFEVERDSQPQILVYIVVLCRPASTEPSRACLAPRVFLSLDHFVIYVLSRDFFRKTLKVPLIYHLRV
jgi:hypothetical protein